MSKILHQFKCGHTTQCEYVKPDNKKTQNFTLVYAHGFCSDPFGRKPEEIKKWCEAHGVGFFRFEIAGHGSDSARFEQTTMDTYKSQIFEIVEELVDGPIVTAGASLGGWLALLAGCQYPKKVLGIMGLAAAPDFLKTYFEKFMKPEHKKIMDQYGKIEFPTNDFTYTITKQMIESAHDSLLLEKDEIPFRGKVRLLQGMKDASLEWHTVLTIAQKLISSDVQVCLMKDSNHHLSSDDDIEAIYRILDSFLVFCK